MTRTVLGGAFTLLDVLVSRPGEIGLSEIAHVCGIPKATAYRLLNQLEALELVERSNGRYRVGAYAFRLGQAWEPYPGLLGAVRQPLRELAASTRTSAVLTVTCHGEVLVAASSLAGEKDADLRPGRTVPGGVDLLRSPVFAPTGETVGQLAVAVNRAPAGDRRAGLIESVRHAARAVSTGLRHRQPHHDQA